MYLLDTNIWLERLLDHARSEEVGRFLSETPPQQLFLTDFSFHFLALVMTRLNRPDSLVRFVQDVLIDGAVSLVRLEPEDTPHLVGVMGRFALDFDDAYQYTAAEKHDLTIVSFDTDFDATERGRTTPASLVEA
jgi:predicted nucleic acid-binding protein